MDQRIQAAIEIQEKYRDHPEKFVREILGAELWDKQVEIMQSVAQNQQTAVQSCYGSGKSFSAARLAIWYAYTHVPSKVICTSSSWPQVEKILFAELGAAHKMSKVPLGGRMLSVELQIAKDWFVIGVSPQVNLDSEAYRFEGYHSPNVFVIIDQAQGINPKLWDVGVSLVTTNSSRILVLGNPTSPSGRFFEACKSPNWNKIKISAFDTPNVISDKEIIPGLVTKKWIKNRTDDWGVNNPLYITKVLAEFPEEADDILIPLFWAERATKATVPKLDSKGLGVDVARFGSAQTVFVYTEGNKVVDVFSHQGKDLMQTVGRIKQFMDKYEIPDRCVAIDDAGVGGGVVDRLHEDGWKVRGINNGAKAEDPEHFFNLSAEMHWKLRRLFETDNISIPDHTVLISQLVGRKYSVMSKGKGMIKIETKEEMQRRGLKSPDFADALVLSFKAQEIGGGSDTGSLLTIID